MDIEICIHVFPRRKYTDDPDIFSGRPFYISVAPAMLTEHPASAQPARDRSGEGKLTYSPRAECPARGDKLGEFCLVKAVPYITSAKTV